METTDKHIVAIDLGSWKIALTVARIDGEDVQIIYYREIPSEGMRYSSVFNPSHVARPISNAIAQAEEELGIKITQAVVGMPKFPIRQETSTGKVQDRGAYTDITTEDISNLKAIAQSLYPLQDESNETVYGAVAQSFSDGENFQIIEDDIVGMTSDVLEGNFKIFIGKKTDLTKIDTAMAKAGIAAMRKYFTADSTAKAVLHESEMENGVALIDFGAGSTSVSIYHGNIMRHYASIPFGGNNITHDIKTECQISEQLAENIKLAFGACMPEKLQSLSEKTIHIRSNSAAPDKQLPVKYLSEIITARVEEIMMAVLYEIHKSGFADVLRSGIVITGGCARIANLGGFVYDLSGYKVRTGYPKSIFSYQGCDGITDSSAATSIGLILAAMDDQTVSCAICNEVPATVVEETMVEGIATEKSADDQTAEQGSLFNTDQIEEVAPKPKQKPKQSATRTPSGIKVTWTKFTKFCGGLYDSVNEEIENDKA